MTDTSVRSVVHGEVRVPILATDHKQFPVAKSRIMPNFENTNTANSAANQIDRGRCGGSNNIRRFISPVGNEEIMQATNAESLNLEGSNQTACWPIPTSGLYNRGISK